MEKELHLVELNDVFCGLRESPNYDNLLPILPVFSAKTSIAPSFPQ